MKPTIILEIFVSTANVMPFQAETVLQYNVDHTCTYDIFALTTLPWTRLLFVNSCADACV